MTRLDTWNHNNEVGQGVVDALPAHLGSALEVGCGQGYLLPALAARADVVVGLDAHGPSLAAAAARCEELTNVELVEGDALTTDLGRSFDAVVAVAVLHHLPLEEGLVRLRGLIAPGGTIGVVGLARSRRPRDWWLDGIGAVETRWKRVKHSGYAPITAPVRHPTASYTEVEATAMRVLPGARYRRHSLFRYSLLWTRPRR
jgi:SAM-dependent methyltransferase